MPIPLISFFTGGGFLDMGFEAAGFGVVWTNELNVGFADMYEYAIASWRQARGWAGRDNRISCRDDIQELTAKRVLREGFPGGLPGLFGIIGGPPCPDFSAGGRHGGAKAARGRLSQIFADKVCTVYPHFFVMENVPGLQRTRIHSRFLKRIMDQLEGRGYAIDSAIPNALEFGVPQDRERLFVVGIRRSLVLALLRRRFLGGEREWFSWPAPSFPDAKTLPWPDVVQDGCPPTRPEGLPDELIVNTYLAEDPKPEHLPNGGEYFRPYSARFWTQKEGDVRTKSFKRLHRYRYSPTAWYGNNEVHLHPWEKRRLSVREALRIQSIPDDYVLPEDKPLSKKFKLICNGVPYLLAKRVAESLREFLRPLTE